MLKNPTTSSMRFIRRGAYSFALAIPLLAGSGISVSSEEEARATLKEFNQDQFEIADKKNDEGNQQKSKKKDPLVLISEVVIEGIEGHPEEKKLEYDAYDAMSIRPGSRITKSELQYDLNAIYATGWFAAVSIEPLNTPLGVQLLVKVEPNPSLRKIELDPRNTIIPQNEIDNIFKTDYGRTLNLNALQFRMRTLKQWYISNGYSLARIAGPNRVTSDGIVRLKILEGSIGGIEINYLDDDGNTIRDNGKPVRGKTKRWVIERELSTKPGVIFNRAKLEADIKRLYRTSLFSDVKVTLKPVEGEPGKVIIVLGITEQRTGSLTGGIGYSGAQGVFGQVGVQETNLLGRAWSTDLNFTYGEYGTLVRLSLADPWIKGDKYRTSFRTNVYISRDVPQAFRSKNGGNILGASDYYQAPGSTGTSKAYDVDYTHTGITNTIFNTVSSAKSSDSSTSWFDYDGDSVLLQRSGGGFSLSRPLNGGNPFIKAPWSVLLGMNFQKVEPIDYSGSERPYGVAEKKIKDNSITNDDIICVAFNCAKENTLVSFRTAIAYNKLNDTRNPTSGHFLKFGTEQFLSIGQDSPTFNRAKTSYSYFIPVNFLKLHKNCRPKRGEKINCPQTIGFHLKAGTIVGDLPPYEAFCIGGSKSVRGWSACDLGVSRSFGEGTAEYRFPIWRMVSGNVFFDAGTDFGSQENVPGKPGKLLGKEGSGFSVGSGLSLNTPLGPLRLEAASQDLGGDWRYNIGFGWKF